MGRIRLLTIKSSESRTSLPPISFKSCHKLYPKIQGMLITNIKIQLIITAFFLSQWKLSILVEIKFSKTAITVEKLAKVIKRKKRAPQILPNCICMKTFGKVKKIRGGPAFGSTPKLKQAGKIMSPAIIATKVSNAQIFTPSLTKV